MSRDWAAVPMARRKARAEREQALLARRADADDQAVVSDSARIAPTLTVELAVWLDDLAAWTAGHRLLSCDCVDTVGHEARRRELMERKADLLARCRAAEGLS